MCTYYTHAGTHDTSTHARIHISIPTHPLSRATVLTIVTVTTWDKNREQHQLQQQHLMCRCSFFLSESGSSASVLTNLPTHSPSLLTSFSTHTPALSLRDNADGLHPQPWAPTQTLTSPPGLTLLSRFQLLPVSLHSVSRGPNSGAGDQVLGGMEKGPYLSRLFSSSRQ